MSNRYIISEDSLIVKQYEKWRKWITHGTGTGIFLYFVNQDNRPGFINTMLITTAATWMDERHC